MLLRVGFVLVLVLACACAQRTVATVAQPSPAVSATPQVWEGPGETASPLPLARGPAVDVAPPASEPRTVALARLPDDAKLVTSGGGIAYYFSGTQQQQTVHAVDLVTGAERWQARDINGYDAAASSSLLFAVRAYRRNDRPGAALALDARTGRVVATLPGVGAGHVLNGFYYANRSEENGYAFVAIDARTARVMWENRGAFSVGGTPVLVGTTLLQSFSESGAILVNRMHGFDVVTGRERWWSGWGPEPLGVAGNLVYLDSTWFPMQLDNYFPLAVTTLDLTTGTALHEYGYKPDRARNWPRKPDAPYTALRPQVVGGFVYFGVGGTWYRYDADRPPAQAHPVRLDGIDDVVASFDGGALLVTSAGETAIAHAAANRLTLDRLAAGAPRSPVVARGDTPPSAVVVRSDGRRYAVIGDALYAFDPRGEHVRRLGAVACAATDDVVTWDAHVAVLCADARGAQRRALLFDDVPVREVALPHPEPTPAPAFTLRVVQHPVPPNTARFGKQWWPSAIAPGPDGTTAIALTPGGGLGVPSAIGRVDAQGNVRLTVLDGTPAPWPRDVGVDVHGTIWFNDEASATVTALDPAGATHVTLIGEASPTPAPTPVRRGARRLFRGAIRIAIGPDGEAWFARSHPTREIGRVDGTFHVDVPDDVGDVLALRGARDGLWFATAGALGFVTRAGALERVAVPAGFFGGYAAPRLAVAPDGTVWAAGLQSILHADRHGVLRTVRLPNASARAGALTVGCDGTLYAVDALGAQLARIAPSGTLEEYATGLYSIDALATATDCRTWFVGGSNAPDQQVGTFTFTPRRTAR